MARWVAHTSVAEKRPKESLVTQREVCLFVYCGEEADHIEKELATLLADLRSFSRNGVEVLSIPDDKSWSALGGNTTQDVEEVRDEQSSLRVWSPRTRVEGGPRLVRHRSGCVQRRQSRSTSQCNVLEFLLHLETTYTPPTTFLMDAGGTSTCGAVNSAHSGRHSWRRSSLKPKELACANRTRNSGWTGKTQSLRGGMGVEEPSLLVPSKWGFGHTMFKRCSTFLRGRGGGKKKYETFFPFRCPQNPPKQR